LGFGFDGRGLIWERDGIEQTYLYFTLNATHLFKSEQRRSFDFFNNVPTPQGCERSGFGSRYILVKEFDEAGNYTGTTLPAINVSTLCCDVSVDIQFDLAVMFAFQRNRFGFDIGYNGFIRSRERIHLDKNQFPERKYAFKGIQNAENNITQSNATLDGNVLALAFANEPNFAAQQAFLADNPSPVFIQANDLNSESAASPLIVTHKIFWYAYYSCDAERFKRVTPYYGLGGNVEFEGDYPRRDQPNKDSMSQWGIWAKGGLAF